VALPGTVKLTRRRLYEVSSSSLLLECCLPDTGRLWKNLWIAGEELGKKMVDRWPLSDGVVLYSLPNCM
jgi:hypothetical protein